MDTKSLMTVARLIDELNGVEGRTRLQKIVHLLSQRFPMDFRQRFTLHYFGPYSRELADQVDFLIAARVLNENPPDEDSGAGFRYAVADDRARNRIAEAGGTTEWITFARRLAQEKKSTLEALSTLVFLRDRSESTDDLLRREFGRIKPHLTHSFDTALKLADELLPSHSL